MVPEKNPLQNNFMQCFYVVLGGGLVIIGLNLKLHSNHWSVYTVNCAVCITMTVCPIVVLYIFHIRTCMRLEF